MASLKIRDVKKSYGDLQVMHGVDLDVEEGEFVVFVGPSGCGKSTLLRMIAGLEEVTSGEISIGDKVVNEVAPAKRGVAMVFQSYAIYPHMTVFNNMAFGLKQAKTPPKEIDRRVREAAEVLQITDYLDRSPATYRAGSVSAWRLAGTTDDRRLSAVRLNDRRRNRHRRHLDEQRERARRRPAVAGRAEPGLDRPRRRSRPGGPNGGRPADKDLCGFLKSLSLDAGVNTTN